MWVITGCSDNSTSNDVDSRPIPDETEGCAPIERSKLFPIVGAFLGPDPGPCTLTSGGSSYQFHYGPDSTLINQVDEDGQDDIEFHYAEDLLVSEKRTQPSGVSMTTYEYGHDAIQAITVRHDGASTGYIYQLDERGYVRSARLLNAVTSASIPTHYTYEYQGCAVRWRVAYDPNDSPNIDATLQYFYDDSGRLTKRSNNAKEELFEYSCW